MNLSEKVEETFEKLKPHESGSSSPKPHEASAPVEIREEKSGFSLNLAEIRDYLLVIICFGVALASIFLLIIPQYRNISTVSESFNASQSKLSDLVSQSNYLEGLVGLKEELEANIELANQTLPATEDRVPYTLDQIVQIAEASGVTVESLSLGGINDPVEGSGDNLRTVLIQTSVTGTRENVLEFFYNLENARTIIDSSNFQLSTQTVAVEITGDEENPFGATEIVQQSAVMVLVSYLKEDEETAVDLSALANSPSYENLFTKLKSMDYYEATPLDIELGRDNPFSVNEASESFIPLEDEEEPVIEEDDDASGIE